MLEQPVPAMQIEPETTITATKTKKSDKAEKETAQKYEKVEKERLELSKRVQLFEAQAGESKVLREELLKLSSVNVELQALKTRLVVAEEARDRALVRPEG